MFFLLLFFLWFLYSDLTNHTQEQETLLFYAIIIALYILFYHWIVNPSSQDNSRVLQKRLEF